MCVCLKGRRVFKLSDFKHTLTSIRHVPQEVKLDGKVALWSLLPFGLVI